VSERRLKAVYATLMVQFGVTPGALALLTDWQIIELYFHRRNRDGGIDIPGWEPAVRAKAGPATLESDLKAVEMLAAMFGPLMTAGSVEDAKRRLREKYGAAVAPPGEEANGRSV
jgi:hypothetical protein